jgi:hypothetical protein
VSIEDSAAWDYVPESRPSVRPAAEPRPGVSMVADPPLDEGPPPSPEPGAPETLPEALPVSEPEPSTLPDDLVTRLISAQTYLRESFADRVAGDLLRPTRRAFSPLWQVDAVEVARHAAQAKRYRKARDTGLAAVLGYVLAAGTLVLAAAFVGWLALPQAAAIWLVLWLWCYFLAVRLVYTQSLAARRSAVATIYEPAEVRPEPLARASVEDSLAELNRNNVVLFRGDSSPFVGSGVNVDNWSLTIDLRTRAAPAHSRSAATAPEYTNRPALPDEVTGGELQEHLLRTLPTLVSPRPAAVHRLYVRGGTNALSVPLFRSGPVLEDPQEATNFRRPVSRVPDDVVQHYLHQQDEGARVYTCFTHSAWGGQVVVTLFVRAFVSNQTLFIEGLVYALRPLAEQFYAVRGLPTDRRAEASALFREALSDAPTQLAKAPGRLLAAQRSTRAKDAADALLEEEIVGRRDIDFGAWPSLRERMANYNLGDQFAAMDEKMYYQIFNRRAMECIGGYLESRHVDLSEFNGQAGGIIGSTTANARSIYGSAVDNGVSATDAGD